ncbi:hypothetical protein RIR_jg31511.t1 [Rhizophagus irregularis DAOM 181602=DAOM 197198]|nr:hypothetical protein RIR_jg31511.t1 [Rhizophagus irregularis DAOM 181602=DAOM 197198]
MNSINVLLSSLFIDTKHSITDYMKDGTILGNTILKTSIKKGRRPVLCNIWKRGMFCDLFFRIFGRVGRGGYSAPFCKSSNCQCFLIRLTSE